MDTVLVESEGKVSEPFLFLVTKGQFRVLREGSGVDRMIGRVAVDKVASYGLDYIELLKLHNSFLKRDAALLDIVALENLGVVIAAYRNVELPLLVHSIEPVVATLVQVYEPRRNVNRVL